MHAPSLPICILPSNTKDLVHGPGHNQRRPRPGAFLLIPRSRKPSDRHAVMISLQLTSLLGRDEGGSRSDESEEGEKAHHFECSIMYWIYKQRVMRIGREGEQGRLVPEGDDRRSQNHRIVASQRGCSSRTNPPGSFRRGDVFWTHSTLC